MFELIESKLKDYSDIQAKFAEATNTIAFMESELTELRQFKADTESAIFDAKIEEVFSNFADLAGIEAFESLKEHCKEYDLMPLRRNAMQSEEGIVLI